MAGFSKTEEAATRVLSNLPTLRRHRRVAARRARLQSPARSALNGRGSRCSLEKINYPGSGNASAFSYEPVAGLVEIMEVEDGTIISDKQIVNIKGGMTEERTVAGAVLKKYFGQGCVIQGATMFFAKDHLGSVRSSVMGCDQPRIFAGGKSRTVAGDRQLRRIECED